MTVMMSKYAKIPAPGLVIFAIPHVQVAWMTQSEDPAVRTAAKAYFTKVDVIAEKQAKAFEEGVTSARVIRLRGMHYIFVSNESDVLREMRAFLGSLR
jgi:non-heme chloroperoxidase